MSGQYKFYRRCTDWGPVAAVELGGLSDMVDSMQMVQRRTFLQHADRGDLRVLEAVLGYDKVFPMSNDPYVQYFRAKLYGQRVYGFVWSAMEYVFCTEESMRMFEERSG